MTGTARIIRDLLLASLIGLGGYALALLFWDAITNGSPWCHRKDRR